MFLRHVSQLVLYGLHLAKLQSLIVKLIVLTYHARLNIYMCVFVDRGGFDD